jgi:preprotein translocase, SecE subunit, bacterial
MAAKQSNEAFTASSDNAFVRFREYLTESKAEIKKVTWPTKKEARVTSIAVLILVVVMSIFLGVVDLGWTKIIELILS